MKTRISKRFHFSAAHHLTEVPPTHKCARNHGHNYSVELVYEGPIDPKAGWLLDFAEIDVVWDSLNRMLDHHDLNEIPGLENPTSENLAVLLLRMLTGAAPHMPLAVVRVSEGDETCAEVRAVWAAAE